MGRRKKYFYILEKQEWGVEREQKADKKNFRKRRLRKLITSLELFQDVKKSRKNMLKNFPRVMKR